MKTQTINIPGFGEVSLISLSKVIASLPETASAGRLALAINQDGDLSLIPVGGGGSVSVKNSLEFDNGSIQLVGDAETPGNLRYYGTDSNGEKGFFALPALSDVVTLTGNQTIAGVKTFSLSPIVPDPTTDGEAANKKYVDDNAGETNTASNAGAGTGIFKQKTGVDLELKSLVAGDNVNIETLNADEVRISAELPEPPTMDSNEINFDQPREYGSISTPRTGNLTQDLTGAKRGIVQKIYHQQGAEPDFPTGWIPLDDSAEYSTEATKINLIFANFAGSGNVLYWIATMEAPSE